MSRRLKITLLILLIGVLAGGIYLRGLHQQLLGWARAPRNEEQARRQVVHPPVATPTDVKKKAKIFWATEGADGTLEPVEVELSLSSDPVQRAKQVIGALSSSPPKNELRTLPADAMLLEFYLLPDGNAIADFSDALARNTPSGILSEQTAVDSIARTLEANVPDIRRLKILINGQEAETLAGHLDLTDFFVLHPPEPPKPALTQSGAPGKLER